MVFNGREYIPTLTKSQTFTGYDRGTYYVDTFMCGDNKDSLLSFSAGHVIEFN